jgi:hypothetical protein
VDRNISSGDDAPAAGRCFRRSLPFGLRFPLAKYAPFISGGLLIVSAAAASIAPALFSGLAAVGLVTIYLL